MFTNEQRPSSYTSDAAAQRTIAVEIMLTSGDMGAIPGPHTATDTRIVACLVQLSRIKHIANAGIEPLIFGGSGNIKAIVGDAFSRCRQ